MNISLDAIGSVRPVARPDDDNPGLDLGIDPYFTSFINFARSDEMIHSLRANGQQLWSSLEGIGWNWYKVGVIILLGLCAGSNLTNWPCLWG